MTVLGSAPGPAAHGGRPGRRWGRPLNFGLAAALAGCALGGVAVAAGTGVLPTPFGDSARPQPAVSVSVAGTPDARIPPVPGTATPSDPPSSTRDPRISGGGTQSPGTPETSPDPTDDGGTGTHDPGAGTPPQDSRERDRRWLVQACRDYHSGKSLAGDSRQRLEEGAGGAHQVERFCRRLLGVGTDDGEKKGDRDKGSDGDDDSGGGDDDGDDAERSSGDRGTGMVPVTPEHAPVPPLGFVAVPPAGVTLFEPVTQN
ncbi:hypothetical protein [Streptomyces sp. SYSU K217416]